MENIKVSTTCSCGKQIPFEVSRDMLGKTCKVVCPFCHQQKTVKIPQSLENRFNKNDCDKTFGGDEAKNASLFLETLASPSTPSQLFTISSEYNTVGRKNESGPEYRPDVEVKTADKKMSRVHAAVSRKRNGGFTIKNLPSGKNGLWLNGKRIENETEVYLKSGDLFRLGETVFRVTIKDSRTDDKEATC